MPPYPKCINGHPLNDENFRISDSGKKACRKCSAIASKRWRKKNRKHMREYLREYRKRKRNK